MSHFPVLVIGEAVEGQLAPYDENIEVEPYKSYWDSDTIRRWEMTLSKTERGMVEDRLEPYPDELVLQPVSGERPLEEIARVYNARYHGGKSATATMLDLELGGEWGGCGVDEGGIFEWSTYNPKSRWDWYQVGGRWRGYFKVKADAFAHGLVGPSGVFDNEPRYEDGADVLRKGMVDVNGMREEAGDAAGRLWDKVQTVIGDMPKVTPWLEVIADLTNESGEVDIEGARAIYGEQQAVKAVTEHDKKVGFDNALLPWFGDEGVEQFQVGAEEYIQRARDAAIVPYAYVYEGVWHAPGKMGWFGMSDDDPASRRHYEREFNEMFEALPDETPLTLVDCHI